MYEIHTNFVISILVSLWWSSKYDIIHVKVAHEWSTSLLSNQFLRLSSSAGFVFTFIFSVDLTRVSVVIKLDLFLEGQLKAYKCLLLHPSLVQQGFGQVGIVNTNQDGPPN